MNKQERFRQILLQNGFRKQKYETLRNDFEEEYVPTDDRVDIIINDSISIRTSECDGRIRLHNNQIIFLDNYQDYWGGWFKNEFDIDIDIVKNLKIRRFNYEDKIVIL